MVAPEKKCWGQVLPECRQSGTPKLGRGEGEARTALHIELFPSLLSCEGAFLGVVDSLVQENASGASPKTPNLAWLNYKTTILNN